MGSVASFDSDVVLVTERNLKVSTPNTVSEVEALLEELGQPPVKSVPVEFSDIDLKSKDYIGFSTYCKPECHTVNSLTDVDFESYIDVYYPEDYSNTCGLIAYTIEEMLNLDLLILREYTKKDQPVPLDINKYENIASVSGYIYCNSDNSEATKVTLSKSVLKRLQSPNVYLQLQADGYGEHC